MPNDQAELIFSYTRAQALADGVLFDVTKMAREAGFTIPVAITAAVKGEYVSLPKPDVFQSEDGRLWDILFMLYATIRARGANAGAELLFELHVQNDPAGEPQPVTLKAVCGPNDDHSPCLTIMLPNED